VSQFSNFNLGTVPVHAFEDLLIVGGEPALAAGLFAAPPPARGGAGGRRRIARIATTMRTLGLAALLAACATTPAAASTPPLPSVSTWDRVMLTAAAAEQGAVCLDGSPGGYFIKRGDPQRWIVFMQGGGWCTSDMDCAARAFGAPGKPGHPWLGSSTAWPKSYVDQYEGSQLFADPAFSNYTIVFAPYCDGGSWTGNADTPVPTAANSTSRGKPIYYRGARLLDALLDSVLAAGLKNATNLLWAGCSAGGLTTYLHADYVAERVGSGVRVLALADAMFSLEYEPFSPPVPPAITFPQEMAWGYTHWNASGRMNHACLVHYGAAAGWRCLLGANVAPHVKTPLFVLNSKFDTWQGGAIIAAATGYIGKENRTVQAFWLQYAADMVGNFSALPPQHGGFLGNCPAHCQTGRATHGHDPAHRNADPWTGACSTNDHTPNAKRKP
jgi:hypothetical protein